MYAGDRHLATGGRRQVKKDGSVADLVMQKNLQKAPHCRYETTSTQRKRIYGHRSLLCETPMSMCIANVVVISWGLGQGLGAPVRALLRQRNPTCPSASTKTVWAARF